MTEHFQSLLNDFHQSVDGLNEDTSPAVESRRYQSIRQLRLKLAAYKDLLMDQADVITEGVDQAEALLKAKLAGDTPVEPAEEAEDDSDEESEPNDAMDRLQALLG